MKKVAVSGALAAALTGAALAVSAAGAASSGPQVTIVGTGPGSSVKVTGTPQAGYTRFTFTNVSKREQDLSLVKLKAGVTGAQVVAKADAHVDPTSLQKYATFIGGSSATAGSPYTETLKLSAGNYAIADVTKKPKLVASFTVAGKPYSITPAPKATATITMHDFMFMGSSTLPAKGIVKIVNHGPSPHFMFAVGTKSQADAKTVAAAAKSGKDKAAQKLATGFATLLGIVSPGTTSYVQTNLKPGWYVLICDYSDAKSKGKPHAMLGMEKVVHVK